MLDDVTRIVKRQVHQLGVMFAHLKNEFVSAGAESLFARVGGDACWCCFFAARAFGRFAGLGLRSTSTSAGPLDLKEGFQS